MKKNLSTYLYKSIEGILSSFPQFIGSLIGRSRQELLSVMTSLVFQTHFFAKQRFDFFYQVPNRQFLFSNLPLDANIRHCSFDKKISAKSERQKPISVFFMTSNSLLPNTISLSSHINVFLSRQLWTGETVVNTSDSKNLVSVLQLEITHTQTIKNIEKFLGFQFSNPLLSPKSGFNLCVNFSIGSFRLATWHSTLTSWFFHIVCGLSER